MATTGIAELDFGAFPGSSHATVAVTGQAGIASGSLVEAWLRPVATADHTADEHMVEPLKVFAADIVAGTGFTIHGFNTNQVQEPLVPSGGLRSHVANVTVGQNYKGAGDQTPSVGGKCPMPYGRFTVAWVWN